MNGYSTKTMLSKFDLEYILLKTKELLPECLTKVVFDPTVKEPGHTYGEAVEELLVNKLVEQDDQFLAPIKKKGFGKQTRKMEDLIFVKNLIKNLINIKLGYEKGDGQPNMVSFNRLVKQYHSKQIDSYYILIIDVSGKTKDNLTTKEYMFNLFDYLDYVNYNYGTGQIMLKEKQFFTDYDSNKYFNNDKKDIMIKLSEIDKEAFHSHMKLKETQHNQKQEVFNEYR
jgi:hypothetical protein